MPLVCFLSSTKEKCILNARTKNGRDGNVASRGVRLQETSTRIRNGDTVKWTKMPRIVRIVTAAAENGHLTGSVSPALLLCALSVCEAVAGAPSVEMAEERGAVFHFSIKIRSFTTAWVLIGRRGVRLL